jgi:hypothetical protein
LDTAFERYGITGIMAQAVWFQELRSGLGDITEPFTLQESCAKYS